MLCVFATAQESNVSEYLYIYRNGKSVRQILLSEIDSLVFVDTTPDYEAIDLGLPSGLKWASFNVGATKPEEYGGYYAWGEIEEKKEYTWETYKWCNGSKDSMIKYCADIYYGVVDNKAFLEPEDDVAHVEWGGNWRMPTKTEQDELRNECTWEWTSLKDVNGYKVTGHNGNSIFLPAAGYRNGVDINYRNECGYYWSNSTGNSSNCFAYAFDLGNGYHDWANGNRNFGQTVRPVCE